MYTLRNKIIIGVWYCKFQLDNRTTSMLLYKTWSRRPVHIITTAKWPRKLVLISSLFSPSFATVHSFCASRDGLRNSNFLWMVPTKMIHKDVFGFLVYDMKIGGIKTWHHHLKKKNDKIIILPLHQVPEQDATRHELPDVEDQSSSSLLLQSFPGQELQAQIITWADFSNFYHS